ncbi:MAG TPA: alpha-L-fucosidase [Kiritimatiellia bacterium]|nr:alpha-L-fucosidase [Kiritimatiellia bacterium]HPS06981.1 alpha-L-fucosidase [Kiritimatiellia bacterium]
MKCCLALALLAYVGTLHAQTAYKADWESLDKRPLPVWWQEAKFGIFIHWGVYAVPAYAPTDEANVYAKYSEHYDNRLRTGNAAFTNFHARTYGARVAYADFAAQFRAEHFNPDQWADLFKKSGAKYVVLTSKHHDGFALFPSAYSPRWNAQVLGPHRDLAGDLIESVRKQGLHMGYYYSLLEWGNPLYAKATIGRWVQEMNIPQMKELVTRYKPDVLWTDGEWDFTDEELRSVDFLAWLYNESPVKDTVVVNDRWGKKTRGLHGGHFTTEYDLVHTGSSLDTQFVHPWEECRGIGGSFGFNRFETTAHYMTSAQCVETLVEKVSRGGNLLLNIGPQADGLIPVIMQERLLDMGRWLEVNGEAIYATTAWRRRPKNMRETKIYFTRKPDALYAICARWPQGPLTIDHVAKADGVTLLGSSLPVPFSAAEGKLTLQPPAVNPGNMPCEFAWTFKIANPQE